MGAAWAQTDVTSADAKPTTIAILDVNDIVELLRSVSLKRCVTPRRCGAFRRIVVWRFLSHVESIDSVVQLRRERS
jgi:hypothetical protein